MREGEIDEKEWCTLGLCVWMHSGERERRDKAKCQQRRQRRRGERGNTHREGAKRQRQLWVGSWGVILTLLSLPHCRTSHEIECPLHINTKHRGGLAGKVERRNKKQGSNKMQSIRGASIFFRFSPPNSIPSQCIDGARPSSSPPLLPKHLHHCSLPSRTASFNYHIGKIRFMEQWKRGHKDVSRTLLPPTAIPCGTAGRLEGGGRPLRLFGVVGPLGRASAPCPLLSASRRLVGWGSSPTGSRARPPSSRGRSDRARD